MLLQTVLVNGSEHALLNLVNMYDLLSGERSSVPADRTSGIIHWSHPFIEFQSTLISLSKAVWNSGELVREFLIIYRI